MSDGEALLRQASRRPGPVQWCSRSKEPYKDAHCSACRQPGPSAEPQDPNVLYPHCPHDLGDRPPHLVGRGFSGSEGLSFSSCCQTEWGCSPEIPPGKARRAVPTCHPGQGLLGKTGEKAPGCLSSFYLVVCEIWFLGWGRGMQDVRGKLGTPRCAMRVLGLAWAARGVGVGLEPRGRPRASRACRGVHRAPGSRLHVTGVVAGCRGPRARGLTHLLKSKGIVPPSRWERCRPGGPQRRVGPSPLPTPPRPPRPRQPARHSPLATRLPPPGSDAPSSPLGAAVSPGRPFRRPVKGARGPAGWGGPRGGMLPKPRSPRLMLWFLLASDLFFPSLSGASGQIPVSLAVGFVLLKQSHCVVKLREKAAYWGVVAWC